MRYYKGIQKENLKYFFGNYLAKFIFSDKECSSAPETQWLINIKVNKINKNVFKLLVKKNICIYKMNFRITSNLYYLI